MNHKITDTTLKSNNQNNRTSYISRKNYADNKKLLNKNKFMIIASIISISLIVIMGIILKRLSKKSDVTQEIMIIEQKNKENKENINDLKKDDDLFSNNKENKLYSDVQEELKETNHKNSHDSNLAISNHKKSVISSNNKTHHSTDEINKKLNSQQNIVAPHDSNLNKISHSSSLHINDLKKNTSEKNFLQTTPDNYYTIQFSSSSNLQAIKNYAKNNKLNPYWIHKISKNSKYQYLLVSGTYSSLEEAQNVIKKLPENLKINKPWIRKIKQIKQ
ncbi:SPOR domain-containing protein [Wigglesworthia glossinidia]|nr:SPOR domain-containing protein [Wigglesworthia glossinidia]